MTADTLRSKTTALHYPMHRPTFILALLLLCQSVHTTDLLDNTCTFKVQGRLFLLAYLNRSPTYYTHHLDQSTEVAFNFCEPFVPSECLQLDLPYAYSYLIRKEVQAHSSSIICLPYSSNSKTAFFDPQYINDQGEIKLNLTMSTEEGDRSTVFLLDCQ